MAVTPVNVGSTANDTTGDTHRAAFQKLNGNDADLQTQINTKANASALGSAAAQNVEAFATAAQGAKADSAVQPAAIGSTVQGYDADLAAIGALAKTDGGFIVGDGSTWTVESGSAARSSLGLGTAATTDSSAYATSTQGGKADSAVQPARQITAGTGLAGGGDLSANRSLELSSGSQTSLGKADTAIQPAGGLVYVNHGATAGTTRPAGAAIVYWVGSVEPDNGVDGDLWYDTSGGA